MRNIAALFREYARLDLRRLDKGLSLRDHERWSLLKGVLDKELGPASSPPGTEARRSARRVETQLNCSFATGDDRHEAVVSNLSTGGVFIRTDWPLPVDTALRLKIRLKDAGSEISVEGVVVSNNVGADLEFGVRGMGVRFVRVDAHSIEQISALYSQKLVRDTKRLVPCDAGR